MPPPMANPLVLEPFDHCWPLEADVAAQPQTGHPTLAGLLAHPGLGHTEPLGDLGSFQEPLGQSLPVAKASPSSSPNPRTLQANFLLVLLPNQPDLNRPQRI